MILIKIEASKFDYLGVIRHWPNLKLAKEGDHFWISEISEEQIVNVDLRSIPSIQFFESKDQLLFPLGSSLPISKVPDLMWVPLRKGMKVLMPDFNHNYFGLEQQVGVTLIPTQTTADAYGILVELSELNSWISEVPLAKMKNKSWVVLDSGQALILGSPILSMKGKSYWLRGNCLMPSGFDFKYPFLSQSIQDKINLGKTDWILWNKDGNYTSIGMEKIRPLSRSSVRSTYSKIIVNG